MQVCAQNQRRGLVHMVQHALRPQLWMDHPFMSCAACGVHERTCAAEFNMDATACDEGCSAGQLNLAVLCSLILQVRRMNTGQAPNIAMHAALDRAGVQDDITVLVVDLLSSPSDR